MIFNRLLMSPLMILYFNFFICIYVYISIIIDFNTVIMSIYNKIILTVPHYVCFHTSVRTCDLAAIPFSNIFKNIFNDETKETKMETIIIKSGQNRQILDDNRYDKYHLTIKKDSLLWTTLRETIK